MKIVTFGEVMLRLEPPGFYRFVQTPTLNATFGGAEANVAVSLANFGQEAYFVTKLPAHEIGQWALNELRRYGVRTDYISRGGSRLGIYYNERGASQRPSKCIYDRAHSAIAEATAADFDWKRIFSGARWFHFTGITPALGGNLPALCEEACREAKEAGATISCDLNYRSKLWSREEARAVMTRLAAYVDVCIANEEDAKDVFGIAAAGSDIEGGTLDREGYRSVARQLAERFGFKKVAITLRTSLSASRNKWAAMLYDGAQFYESTEYDVQIVDRVGAGDSFTAGLIHALLTGKEAQAALDFAVAASCLQHSIEGDFNMVSTAEVEHLAQGNASGRIQR